MKEYSFENGHQINIKKLETPWVSIDKHGEIHEKIIRACHDVIIQYQGGVLLVIRERYPVKDILWPIGGGIERGMKIEDSLRKKVKKETNLNLEDIQKLGYARTFFETDPFGHGKGTDTINFMYFAKGKGELKLDDFHSSPTIVLPEQYTKEFRESLHPYVRDFMDLAMPLIHILLSP